jgi:hypothetical protein
VKLEAISLLRFMPAAAADMGDVTREELRQAEQGQWSAKLGRVDDLRRGLPRCEDDVDTEEALGADVPGFDVVLAVGEADDADGPVVELRFSGS